MIIVLDTDDIILAEVAPGLHLDQLQIDLAGVFEAVLRADRDVDRLVFMQDLDLVADG